MQFEVFKLFLAKKNLPYLNIEVDKVSCPLVAVYDEGHLCWSPQISKKSVYLSKKVLKLKIFLNSPKFDEFYMRGIFAFAST